MALGIPGLDGYRAAVQDAQVREGQDLQRVSGVLGLQGLVQQQDMARQKMAMAEEDRARAAGLRELIAKDPRFANDPFLQAVGQSNPAQLLPYAVPKQKDRLPVSVTGGYLMPDGNGGYTFNRTTENKESVSPLMRLMQERDSIPQGDPRRAVLDAAIAKQTTHAPAPSATVVLPKQEGKFQEKVGAEMGQQYSDLLKADLAAPQTVSKYQRLGQLLDQVNTGKFTGLTTDLKAYAKGLGFDLTAMGVADNVAPAQAARALANQLALELRNPAGGAGMPGALSDKDLEFLVQSIPNLENDPQGNAKMIDYRIRLAKREQMVSRMARDYRRKNGRFDEGFYDQLASWSEKNPLFPEAANAPSTPSRKPLSAFGKGG